MTYSPRNPRRGTRRIGWKRGEKSYKRLFLYEFARSNDIERSCVYAHINPSKYYEWVETNFLTDAEISKARAFYVEHHPIEQPEETAQPAAIDYTTSDLFAYAAMVTPDWVFQIGNPQLQASLINHYVQRSRSGKSTERVTYPGYEDALEYSRAIDMLENEELLHRQRMRSLGAVDIFSDDDDW